MKCPAVTGAATAAKYTLSHGTTIEPAVTKDQTSGAGTWVSLGTYALKQGEDTKLKLDQDSAGVVVADAVKLVRDNSAETDTEKRTFTYAYDVNGNLTSIDDTSSGAKIDGYAITYTGLNQVQKVTESLAGAEKKATTYTYDANGQSETVSHPSQFSRYTYDLREKVKTVSVGKSPTDADPKVTSYTYTGRGQKLQETKANGNTVDYTYYLDAALKSTAEKKPNGTLVASHTYAYDANGNKAQDVAKKMNADNKAAYLDSTTDFGYDPARQVRQDGQRRRHGDVRPRRQRQRRQPDGQGDQHHVRLRPQQAADLDDGGRHRHVLLRPVRPPAVGHRRRQGHRAERLRRLRPRRGVPEGGLRRRDEVDDVHLRPAGPHRVEDRGRQDHRLRVPGPVR